MTKYREYVQEMLEKNKDLFVKFKLIHDKFALNPQAYRSKFNRQGRKLVEIIRGYEDKLCSQSEKGQFGKYSAALAQKFQAEVRRHFPKIDHVGVTIVGKTPSFDLSSLKKLL